MENRNLSILLVEDNPKYARLFECVVLEDQTLPMTIQIKNAKTLQQALQFLDEGSFDIIALDLFLPDSRGLEAIIRIQEKVPDTPVVFLTALDDPKMREKALQQGARGYLLKDQVIDRFVPTMREILPHIFSGV
jgi:CheY-like chemotaxis protein